MRFLLIIAAIHSQPAYFAVLIDFHENMMSVLDIIILFLTMIYRLIP